MCLHNPQTIDINNTLEDNVKEWFDYWTLTNEFYITICPLPEDQKKRIIPYIQSAILNWFSSKEISQDNAFDLNKFYGINNYFLFQNKENNSSNLTRSDRTPEVSPEQAPINEDFKVNNECDLEMSIQYNSETDNECNLEIHNNPKPTSSNNNSVLVQETRQRRAPMYLKDYVYK